MKWEKMHTPEQYAKKRKDNGESKEKKNKKRQGPRTTKTSEAAGSAETFPDGLLAQKSKALTKNSNKADSSDSSEDEAVSSDAPEQSESRGRLSTIQAKNPPVVATVSAKSAASTASVAPHLPPAPPAPRLPPIPIANDVNQVSYFHICLGKQTAPDCCCLLIRCNNHYHLAGNIAY